MVVATPRVTVVDIAVPIGSAFFVTVNVTNPPFTPPREPSSSVTLAVSCTLAWPYVAFAADTVTVVPNWLFSSVVGGAVASSGIGPSGEIGELESGVDDDERLLPGFSTGISGTLGAPTDAGNNPDVC